MSLSLEAKNEVGRFLRDGKKIGAIRYLIDTYGFSLEQSRILVEAIEESDSSAGHTIHLNGNADASEALTTAIRELLQQGKKADAIQLAKDTLRIRLRGARILVEDIEHALNPALAGRQRPGGVLLGVFSGIGLVLIGLAVYIYFRQSQTIRQSDLIHGKVVSMQTGNDGMTAPVIEYEWQGKKWVYSSTTYSSPPAFVVDEQVPLYVNRQDPNNITVDSFTERWLIIFILGALGGLFTGIPVAIMYFASRREGYPAPRVT